MTVLHHPGDDTLARHAAGHLAPGPAIVIDSHLAVCPVCRARVSAFETVGGALLDELSPVPVAPEALARTLAMIDEPAVGEVQRHTTTAPAIDVTIPRALGGCRIGRWRWIAPGVRRSRVVLPHDPSANVMLLRIGANRKLLEHGHTGSELTFVIAGAFSDGSRHYAPGDLLEVDSDVRHQLAVVGTGECICLAALEGRTLPGGLIGRMLRPLIGL